MQRVTLTLMVLASLLGSRAAFASSTPFDCLLDTVPVAVKVEHRLQACYAGYGSTLYLKVGDEGAELSGRSDDPEARLQVGSKRLSRGDAERLLRELIAAATREPEPPGCWDSTARHHVTLEWACSADATARGQVSFWVPLCFGSPEGAEAPYSRAQGLLQVVLRALREARR